MPIHGYPGNVITANPTAPTSSVATGVWTTEQQLIAKAAGNWPFTIPTQQISRSLRFNRPDSAYLNRTFSTGNRKTWTWSCWIKRSTLDVGGGDVPLISSAGASSTYDSIRFNSDSTFRIYYSGGAAYSVAISGSPVFRDVSAWYHIVVAQDTTQATESLRLRVWINGVQQTLTGIPAQNYESGFNSGVQHEIGKQYIQSEYFPGYMAEAYFIGGSALTPSSFGQTNASTGVWEPIAYTGSYSGTNSFYLNFSDNSGTTSTTLGKDYSGNGNNWTPNNFSVTAGVNNDSFVDTPTPYGTDTGVGGEVRGNYATLNPLRYGVGSGSTVTISEGNLNFNCSSNAGSIVATINIPSSGKWYWEAVVPTQTYNFMMVGVIKNQEALSNLNLSIGNLSTGYGVYAFNGQKYNNGSSSTYMAATAQNTVMTVAYDADTGSLYVGAGGSWANGSGSTNQTWANAVAAYTGLTGNISPAMSFDTGNAYINFGQRPFAYTAPSGFKALCTQNLPTPTIGATSTTQANDYFNIALYTGNNSTNVQTGLGFQPDMLWFKSRSGAYQHGVFDAVRGSTKGLEITTQVELTSGSTQDLVSFDNNGFTMGPVYNFNSVNGNALSQVAWAWKANGAGSSNTAGNITSTVSVNTTSGFSIVTYTGNGSANQTVGHGLGVAPAFGMLKDRDTNSNNNQWHVFATAVGDQYGYLSATNAFAATAEFYPTSGSSTTVTIGRSSPIANSNESGDRYVMYLFAPVAGYSAFGSYTGNGSTDGPFVYLGFRPEFVMIKNTTTAGTSWEMFDAAREPANLVDLELLANSSGAEGTYTFGDFVSNGFKLRSTNNGVNQSTATLVYMAFAEFPFKYALAR